MSEQVGIEGGTAVLSVSCPGGMARQYRVQERDNATASRWRLVGSFRDPFQAGSCAQRLVNEGRQARVVDCRALPTAA